MPIAPKYTWSQSTTHVNIVADVPAITQHKAEVFGTRALVKVVAHPYFLQLDLAHDVNFARGLATIKSGQVQFKLPKVCFHQPTSASAALQSTLAPDMHLACRWRNKSGRSCCALVTL